MTVDVRTPQPSTPKELVGTIEVPTGQLVLIDFGTLVAWSGETEPSLRDGDAEPQVVERANASVDLHVVGPDALAVASRFDLAAGRGPFFFDLPTDFATELIARISDTARREHLDAKVGALTQRMPHAERARQLLTFSPSGTEVPYQGMWAVAVSGLPEHRSLPIFGQRMDESGPDAGRWWSVWVECSNAKVAKSVSIGTVLVDEARLMWADLASLSAFRVRAEPDDLIDIVFWGKDAATLASKIGAPTIPEEGQAMFGWLDCPESEARQHYERISTEKERDKLLFALDVRPHTHEWELLANARSSPTGSASLQLVGGRVCGFFTSWGDGAFPVYRDVDAAGELVRVRVELGAPEIVALHRKMDERWFGEFAKMAIVSARVAREGMPVGWLYRESPDRANDSGWRVFAGTETQEYLDDATNAVLLPVRDLLERDAGIESVLRTPFPCEFERDRQGQLRRVGKHENSR
jgi:hypothetical protein